jgi:proline racemase
VLDDRLRQPATVTAAAVSPRAAVRRFHAVDSHTEGMPTRVVTDGVGTLPGSTMAERRRWFTENSDDIRRLLMEEPRGHAAMSGAILQPPTRPDADWGVLFIEVSGCLPLCGHGTIGVATVLVETGLVPVVEPVTTVRLDTPAGLVVAEVHVREGAAESVTVRGVPSYCHALDALVDVPGIGPVRCDVAYGGNFYAIVDLAQVGIRYDRVESRRILDAGLAVMAAVNEQHRPEHPESPDIEGCRHVHFVAPGSTARHSRHAMVIHPGWFDRSPCGTGTAARMAQLHARGELGVGDDFVNESFIGSRFTGRLVAETTVGGRPAVVPSITGRAWLTGIGQYLLDPTDPFPVGFRL